MFKSYTQVNTTSLCGRKGQSERRLLHHQAAAKTKKRLQARWRICSHSSSCPRLDQEEMPWFQWKKRLATEFATRSLLDHTQAALDRNMILCKGMQI